MQIFHTRNLIGCACMHACLTLSVRLLDMHTALIHQDYKVSVITAISPCINLLISSMEIQIMEACPDFFFQIALE